MIILPTEAGTLPIMEMLIRRARFEEFISAVTFGKSGFRKLKPMAEGVRTSSLQRVDSIMP
jgi:hypothetical protein